MIHFECPECNRRLKAAPEQAGQFMRCPYCRAKFVPSESPVAGDRVTFASDDIPSFEPSPSEPPPSEPRQPEPRQPEPGRSERRRAQARHSSTSDASDGPLSKPAKEINHEELIDMTAMVDIVFFLLIFFLVTSMSDVLSSAPLPRPEAHNDDGQAKSAKAEEPQNDSNAIVVKINKDDAIEIDGVPFRELTDVTIRLRQLRDSGGPETSVLVIGHGDASHGTAAGVLDAGYEVGINHLRLAVLDDEPE